MMELFHSTQRNLEFLINQIEATRTELANKQPPTVRVINKKLTLWKNLEETLVEVRSKGTYQGCPLVIPVKTHRAVTGLEDPPTDIELTLDNFLKEMKCYMDSLIIDLHKRFQWPSWLSLSETVFDFSLDATKEDRVEALKELMALPSSPHPLMEMEKDRLCAEYSTLLLHAQHIHNTEKINTQEELHYILGTRSDIYEGCENIIDFMLKFLARPTNECIVESTFSMVDDEGRPLTRKNLEDICAIQMNGPHPLRSSELVKMTLDDKFGNKPWHFVVTSQKFFTSKAVSTLFNSAKNAYSLFD